MNSEKYNTVIKDVDKIQGELGMDGVLNGFVDPLKGIQGRNYQVFKFNSAKTSLTFCICSYLLSLGTHPSLI